MVTVVTIAIFREQTGETVSMPTSSNDRAEALAWLAGRLRFEQLLADLQRRAAANSRPVQLEAADVGASEIRKAA